MNIKVGDTVPVLLKLADGDIGMFPQATIRDNDNNLLSTLPLAYQDDGTYIPAAPYLMPDEVFIRCSYIVYENVGHTVISDYYEQQMDVFRRIDVDDYKATGFAVPGEYDAAHAAIQADLDDPDQYKADVQAGLTAQGYTVARAALLDNLDAAISTVITNIAALNDISTADVQAAMTAQGYTSIRAALLDYLDSAISAVPGAVAVVLSGVHGAGSWEGDSAATIDALLTANHGAGVWTPAALAGIALEINATANKDEIIAEVNVNEGKIDVIPDAVLDRLA